MSRLATISSERTRGARGAVLGAALAAAGVLGLAAAEPVRAEQLAQAQAATPEQRAAFDRAFAEMQADPGNLEKTLRFAEAASAAGDSEAAIGALERMLLIDRDIARVNLELGELYFRLKSFTIARRYFERAAASADATPVIRERAAVYLNEAERREPISRFIGNVTLGLRYQSNATYGPEGLRSVGVPVPVPSSSAARSDWNLFGLGYLAYIYDLERQDGMTIDTDLSFYGSLYKDETQLNLGYMELSTGPRFRPFPESLPDFSIRPHIRGSLVWLDDSRYSDTYGAGVDMRQQFGDRLWLDAAYIVRNRSFRNSSDRPTASDLSGVEQTLLMRGRYAVTGDTILGLDAGYAHDDADRGYTKNNRYVIGANVMQRFAAPFSLGTAPWTATLGTAFSWIDYRSPDPAIDPGTTRADREWRISASNVIPLSPDWSVLLQAEYVKNNSNLPNYDYDNASVILGVTRRF